MNILVFSIILLFHGGTAQSTASPTTCCSKKRIGADLYILA
jgi:hypothetical protein